MEKDVLRDRWKHFRSEMNHYWADLSSDDFDWVNGRRDNLVVLLENKYGYARRRAEREVDRVVREFEDKLRRAS